MANRVGNWLKERTAMIVSIIGLIITIAGAEITGSFQDFHDGNQIVTEMIVVMIHIVFLIFNTEIRGFYWVRKKWGVFVQSFIFLATLEASGAAGLINGVDGSWFCIMLGLPIWSIGLELALQAGINLSLVGLSLGISVSTGFALTKSSNTLTQVEGWFFAVIQPFIYTIIYFTFPTSSNNLLEVKLETDVFGNIVEGYFNLYLFILSDEQAQSLLEHCDDGLVQLVQRGGGTRRYAFRSDINPYVEIGNKSRWFQIQRVEKPRLRQIGDYLKKLFKKDKVDTERVTMTPEFIESQIRRQLRQAMIRQIQSGGII